MVPVRQTITLPESSDEEEDGRPREGERRTRMLSNAAALESSDLVLRVTEEERRRKTLDLMRANFEPEVTNEDLGREERESAEQEEAAAVYAFSFPAVLPTPPVGPPAGPEPGAPAVQELEPEEEEGMLLASSIAEDKTFITANLPTLSVRPLSILSHKAMLLDPSGSGKLHSSIARMTPARVETLASHSDLQGQGAGGAGLLAARNACLVPHSSGLGGTCGI
ncbi:hypothetical protein FRC04_000700 [Tulasnella sp. 424]|nr:hypothetical protein FRC04_000700 [Tulasnella sp. 424]KAG8967690.1 hypothetical protein FRC05_001948 [Tulasnella sp. 425]